MNRFVALALIGAVAACIPPPAEPHDGGEHDCASGAQCRWAADRAKTPERKLELLKRSCDLDDARGCLSLAYALRFGRVSPEDVSPMSLPRYAITARTSPTLFADLLRGE